MTDSNSNRQNRLGSFHRVKHTGLLYSGALYPGNSKIFCYMGMVFTLFPQAWNCPRIFSLYKYHWHSLGENGSALLVRCPETWKRCVHDFLSTFCFAHWFTLERNSLFLQVKIFKNTVLQSKIDQKVQGLLIGHLSYKYVTSSPINTPHQLYICYSLLTYTSTLSSPKVHSLH